MILSPRPAGSIVLCLAGLLLAGVQLPVGRAAADSASSYGATIATNDPHVFAFAAPPATFDPTTASPVELRRYGFPLPPDAASHPAQYQVWADDMRHARHEIVPTFVAHPEVQNGTSMNWSGLDTFTHQSSCGGLFCSLPDSPTEVVGAWNVPSVANSTQTSYSSTWVGLDGAANTNQQVEQMGTTQDAVQDCVLVYCTTTTTYYAWYELFPDGEQVIPNFFVGPGDRMYADVQYDASTNALNFFLHDYTRGEYTAFSTPAKYGCGCLSAEWITERPTINKTLPALANFGTATFSYASFRAVLNGWEPAYSAYFQSDPVTMVNGSGATLAWGNWTAVNGVYGVISTWHSYS